MLINHAKLVAATLGLCTTMSAAISPAAFAGQATYTGPQGRTTQVDTTRQKVDNGSTFQRTITLPDSKTVNVNQSFTRTGNGGYQRERVYTGPNGNQTTVNGTGVYQNGTGSGSRTVTYPNGQSTTGTYQYNR